MSNIQIESEVVMKPIYEVKPYVRNPRKNNKTVELLCDLIPKVGFNVPIVIDEKGIIVKGHARFTAAIRLGMTEVPCIVTHADEDTIKADRIMDNKVSEYSEWVNEKLQEEVENIGFDMSDIGLPKITLEDIPSSDGLTSEIETEVKEKPAFGIPVPTPKADPEEKKISEEKMQELVKEFGERKMQELEEDPEFAEFMETPMYQCTCDKCGHTMFFKEGEV